MRSACSYLINAVFILLTLSSLFLYGLHSRQVFFFFLSGFGLLGVGLESGSAYIRVNTVCIKIHSSNIYSHYYTLCRDLKTSFHPIYQHFSSNSSINRGCKTITIIVSSKNLRIFIMACVWI